MSLKIQTLLLFCICCPSHLLASEALEDDAIKIDILRQINTINISLNAKRQNTIPLEPGIKLSVSTLSSQTKPTPPLPLTLFQQDGYLNEQVSTSIVYEGQNEALNLTLSYAYCPNSEICEIRTQDLKIEPDQNKKIIQ